MARTLTQISDALKSAFVADAELANVYGLDQAKAFDEQFSRVSIEGLIIYIIAYAIHTLELIIDTFRTEVDATLAAQYLTSLRYYHDAALRYQHGDALAYNPVTYQVQYATTDTAKQIVAYAAVKTVEPTDARAYVDIKVSGAGKQPLSGAELTAFTAYMHQAGAAGVRYVVTSDAPRECYFKMDIKYEPVVLQNTSTGRAVIVQAISDYLDNLNYGGLVVMSELTARLSALPGVLAVYIESMYNVYYSTEYMQATVESDTGAFVLDTNQQDTNITMTV